MPFLEKLDSWTSSELDNLLIHVIGGDWGKDESYEDDDFVPVMCIRGTEFRNWDSEKGASAVLRKIKSNSLKSRRLETGDILIEISGGGPDQPVGRTVLIDESVFSNYPGKNVVCTNFLRQARSSKLISSGFLNSYLKSFYLSGEVINYQGGSNNLRNLKFKDYVTIEIPIPPFAEQKQIATKLDELQAQVDTIKTRLDAIPAILKRFRQSVLAAAVSGKLTEDWRPNNLEMKNICPDDYFDKKLGGVDLEERYCLIPERWGWVRFGSQVKLINGDRGKNYPNKAEYVEEGLPFINTGHIEPDGSLSLKKMNYISRVKFDILGGGKIQENDLVYCLRGATMGKTAIVNPLAEGAIASSLVIARPKITILTRFAYIFLTSPQGKDLILRFDNGTAQPNLSAKSLALYPLALPPLQEQTEIVRCVEHFFKFTDQIEKQVKSAQTRVNNLTQSILAKAFRGDLTAEWREQHPDLISGENSAKALLEKIKAEREALKIRRPKRVIRKKTNKNAAQVLET